jgi:sigma-B regulation protein RsbU (phosphoserine phosphatase)
VASASHASRKPYLLWGLLALIFLISATYRVLDISEWVYGLRLGRELVRDPFRIDLPHPGIDSLLPEADLAGLKPGDQLSRINGEPFRYRGNELWAALRAARPGDRLTVEATRVVNGQGSPMQASIVLQPLRPGAPSVVELTNFAVLNTLLPIACTVLGFWVAAIRVRDIRAWLLLFMMLGVPEIITFNPRFQYGRQDFFQPIAASYQPLLANLWATAMLLFAVYFPDRLWLDRRVPWLKWLVIAPVVVTVIADSVVFDFVARRDANAAFALHNAFDFIGPYVPASFLLFIVSFFVIMASRTFSEREPDSRRRLLLLDTGSAVSLVPTVVFLAVILAGRRVMIQDWLAVPIVSLLSAAMLFLLPLTMAYVIVVHRAMDVRVVVRQGVQYLLARGGIRVIQLALIVAVTIGATTMLSGGASTARVAIVVAVLAAVVAIGRRFADRLRGWVDRRFFREAYDAEQVLGELAVQVRTMVETQPLLQTVAQRVADTLHIPHVAILLNDDARLRPAYAVGYPDTPRVVIPESSVVVRRLQRDAHVRVRFDDPDSWVQDLSEEERESLAALHTDILLPLSVNQKVVGVLSLGPKRSEEPYSNSDLRMLGSVATQTGLALENSRLTAEIAAQIAEREKRQRELEIAREVQQRLFPQEYPPVPGLEYTGACRPALEVGGDYYDFLSLSPTELGIAVGDISGKGIPAALLMATLRAFLRAQTIGEEKNLAEMMCNLNALVYESSATNRYATFFFARYNSATNALAYVNAGHNPPMVFRACGRQPPEVIRLDTGGPVIGLLPTCTYEQGNITLKKGDVLIAFTDGISEAMNANDQEWGDERLIEAVVSGRMLAPSALISSILAAADAFVGDAPQHDDMTLVVARCD